jgi:uncharacterized protein YggE
MKPMFAAFAAAVFLAVPAIAQENPPTPMLTANGEGTVMVVPDIAIVTTGVTTRGRTASEALAANSADLAKALATLKDAGVDDKDVGTSNFSISPVYEQPPERTDANTAPPKIVGYEVSNEVRVTIRDITKSGGILDKVVSAGANQVNGISFDVSDRKGPATAALKDAIADANRKAGIMADAAGVKLVRILSVASSEGGGPQPMYRMELAASPPPVMPGQQSVTSSATVVWEIAPK